MRGMFLRRAYVGSGSTGGQITLTITETLFNGISLLGVLVFPEVNWDFQTDIDPLMPGTHTVNSGDTFMVFCNADFIVYHNGYEQPLKDYDGLGYAEVKLTKNTSVHVEANASGNAVIITITEGG